MDVLIVLVFVSLVLVAGSIVLFLFTVRQRDFEHGDRLSLLPLLDSTVATDPLRVSTVARDPLLVSTVATDLSRVSTAATDSSLVSTAATDASRVASTRAEPSLADVQDPSESTRS